MKGLGFIDKLCGSEDFLDETRRIPWRILIWIGVPQDVATRWQEIKCKGLGNSNRLYLAVGQSITEKDDDSRPKRRSQDQLDRTVQLSCLFESHILLKSMASILIYVHAQFSLSINTRIVVIHCQRSEEFYVCRKLWSGSSYHYWLPFGLMNFPVSLQLFRFFFFIYVIVVFSKFVFASNMATNFFFIYPLCFFFFHRIYPRQGSKATKTQGGYLVWNN